MKSKWIEFSYKRPPVSQKNEDFSYVKCYHSKAKNPKRKILILLDYIPSEDLRNGRILSGTTGVLFSRLNELAENYLQKANINGSLGEHEVVIAPYPYYKTFGKIESYVDQAHNNFAKRAIEMIVRFKPDDVMVFGNEPFKRLAPAALDLCQNNIFNWYGVPYTTKVSNGEKEHKINIYLNISLEHIISDKGDGNSSSLIGYASRNLMNIIHGDLIYRCSELKYKTNLVDSIEKFDKMMDYIKRQDLVAVDTETTNLNKIKNKVLIIQFATSAERAFVVPIYHKDTPFNSKELKYIGKEIKKYFEYDNENKFHIYANGTFDLNVIRANFSVRFFKNDIWDVFAGEFALDENLKFLKEVKSGKGYRRFYYYSLLNISMQYGFTGYYTMEFGKENRKVISNVDLDKALIEYCAVDVVILFEIRKLQLQRAKHIQYEKYLKVVKHIGNIIQFFSTLEHNGYKIDLEYLFSMRFENSPLMKELNDKLKEFKNTRGVKKTDELLRSKNNVHKYGLFKQEVSLFSERKDDHLQLLFFEVMKLKPLSITKKNTGSIDKNFSKKYEHKKEVALFNDIGKIKKLINTYVNGFIKKYNSDADMRSDARLRPRYDYLGVVTGRTSASDPPLHQVPSRGSRAKAIKRILVADPNRILIKVDFSAQEVRGWNIISEDEELAEVIKIGYRLRKKFKYKPLKSIKKAIEIHGDIHKINAAYFFKKDIKEIDKTLRQAIKTVVFGLIYQQGFAGLARSTGLAKEEIIKLTEAFLRRFKQGADWIENTKKNAPKLLYSESPIGRRRNLWSFLLPEGAENADSVLARASRLSVNAPVQGMGSDYLVQGSRNLEIRKYNHYRETGHYPDFYQANSVHDSISISCAVEDFWLAVDMIEKALTDDVRDYNKKEYGYDFIVPLEIDFEIGPTEADLIGWDYDIRNLNNIFKNNYSIQKKELKYENVNSNLYKPLLSTHEDMPEWAKKQMLFLDKTKKTKEVAA